jgi:pyruvate dehydrogenase E2 component (dihydrolipoamide acetyltransferase)
VEEEDDVAAFMDFVVEEDSSPAAAQAAASAPTADGATPPAGRSTSTSSSHAIERAVAAEFVLLPSARHLAESKGVDATGLAGTGKGGRVTKGDVLKALASGVDMPALAKSHTSAPSSAATPAAAAETAVPKAVSSPAPRAPSADLPLPVVNPSGSFSDTPNNAMRKIIAKRLTESKRDVPHFYTSAAIELDDVLALRKEWVKKHDVKVSVNDFVLKACAMALRDVPEVNGTYNPAKDEVSIHPTIDISVAVATPTGLITPIVPNTDKRGLTDITNKVRDLATRARDGKLKPEEYQGGTFTVSNLGMFGIQEFSAVINPPQAAILAVGGGIATIVPTPFVDGVALEDQPKPSVKTVMTARLSADRRVVDEPTAALFMQALQVYLSNPKMLMV